VHIAFLGLGLIGGSVARAARLAGYATRITAWTPGGSGPRDAAADGIEASPTATEAIRGADLVVLAAPPLACLDLLDDLAGSLRAELGADTVVTDVASTKSAIVARARSHGLRFVGGHPMAGLESSGYSAADPALFRDRPWIIVPAEPADDAADERVRGLAAACGAIPVWLTADTHDYAVAAISHVPLVLSVSLVEAFATWSDWRTAAPLAAGGWASMTRLARGDAEMGAGIVATNGAAIAARLRELRVVIDDWLELVDGGQGAIDAKVVQARFEAVRRLAESDDERSGSSRG
jgi:prephenate dehydrogenase